MAAPVVTMQQLIEAGAHFGHQTHRWNPRMKPYIFGARNGVHILDLSQTVPLFARALDFVAPPWRPAARCCSSAPSARRRKPIAEGARKSASISSTTAGWAACSPTGRPSRLDQAPEDARRAPLGRHARPHQEGSAPDDARARQAGAVAGRHPRHGRHPDVMFVIDANKEELAIKEANTLGIPVVAILDSNVSPDGIAFPVPANDDASRAIRLYCEAIAAAATKGNAWRAGRFGRRHRRDGRAAGRGSVVEAAEANRKPFVIRGVGHGSMDGN
jgi:small subunit ribosomal protein S2